VTLFKAPPASFIARRAARPVSRPCCRCRDRERTPRAGGRNGLGRQHAGGRGYLLQGGARVREPRGGGGGGGGADGWTSDAPPLGSWSTHFAVAVCCFAREPRSGRRRTSCLLAAAALWRAAKHHVSCQGGLRSAAVPVARAGLVSLRRSRPKEHVPAKGARVAFGAIFTNERRSSAVEENSDAAGVDAATVRGRTAQ
jgi:hypothetical protein